MTKSDIRDLIAQNLLAEAIEAMKPLAAGTRHENELALQASRLKSAEQDNRRGLLSSGEFGLVRNQITHALLELLEEMPEGNEVVPKQKKRRLTCSVTIAFAATLIGLLAGLAEFTGYSLRDLFDKKPPSESIALTVFIQGKNGQSTQPLRQQGYVVLDVNGERKKELIDDKGQASFRNLHVGDQIRHLNVEFSEPFQSTHPDSVYTLDASGQIYLEVALQHLGRVFGTVLTGDQPLAGVIVLVDNTFADTTDITGSYSIEVPENKQRPDPEVKFFKEGYRLEIKKAYPQTNQALNLVMQKLPGKSNQKPTSKAFDGGGPPVHLLGKGRKSGLELVRVEGKQFNMGDDRSKFEWDKPAHLVKVASFWIGKYEVTQADWQEVMHKPSLSENKCSQCPVEKVSWQDAIEFTEKLNEKTGGRYRLPTEAEWELAARGGRSGGFMFSGGDDADLVAWWDNNSGGKTHPIGMKKGNSLGLFDMSGNVCEWCQDKWHANYTGAPQSGAWINNASPDNSRVFRGGCWGQHYIDCNVSVRYWDYSHSRFNKVGFRLAHDE